MKVFAFLSVILSVVVGSQMALAEGYNAEKVLSDALLIARNKTVTADDDADANDKDADVEDSNAKVNTTNLEQYVNQDQDAVHPGLKKSTKADRAPAEVSTSAVIQEIDSRGVSMYAFKIIDNGVVCYVAKMNGVAMSCLPLNQINSR